MPSIQVLVVDDDTQERNLCALELRLAGFEVQTAYDGYAALRMLETFRPAVMILDLRMPFADGFDVLREVHDNAVGQQPMVIVVSGDERGVAAARGHPAVFAALLKPFMIGDLIDAVLRVVRARQQSAPS